MTFSKTQWPLKIHIVDPKYLEYYGFVIVILDYIKDQV